MSEKRFQMGRRIDVVSDIYDSQNDKLLILSDVVDLLNEQQTKIHRDELSIKTMLINMEKLEEEIGEQQATIRKLQDLCGKSDGENMKLRIENKMLEKEVNLLKPTNIEQFEQIQKLQEENEQLKKKLLRIEKTVSLIQKEINNYYNEVCSNE